MVNVGKIYNRPMDPGPVMESKGPQVFFVAQFINGPPNKYGPNKALLREANG